MKRSRLFTRVLLALVALFGGSAVLSSLLAAWSLATTLDAQYRSKALAIARTIANASVDDILLERDSASLQSLVDQYAEIEGVGYILVRDRDGEVLAHTFVPCVPPELLDARQQGPVHLEVQGLGRFLDVPADILDGEIGQVHVGMKQEVIDAAFWQAVGRQALSGALIGIMAVATAYFLVKRFTHPLLRLARHARDISARESLSAPTHPVAEELAPIAGRSDEVGHLATALKHMLEALAANELQLRQAEVSLRLSEQKFRSLIENVSDVVVLLDRSGSARYVSPSLRELLDFSPREWLGRDPALLVHPEDRAAFRAAVAGCAPAVPAGGSTTSLKGDTTSVEVRMLRADGGVRVIDAALCNLLADPAVEGVVVTLRDVTDRKWSLELARAKEQAEEASRLRGQLLQNISHEFFTPMNHILGLTEMMLSDGPAAEQQQDLEQVRASANDLLGVLTSILDFSQLEAGKALLRSAAFQPRELLEGAVTLWQARAESKGLTLSGEAAGEVPDWLLGDADRLRQVLLHLVSNAVKFTDRGEVRVRLGWRAGPADGPRLHLEVSDTGLGIAADMQRRIFEPFVQVDGSLTRRHGGTGLGLAIVRSLVELMGGRLWAESTLGSGSVFHVELPLMEVTATPLAS